MVKSMTAAIAGLKSHQTKMDVLGNNIANVNTWGYKSRTTNFQDAMYTNQISGSGGNDSINGTGGVNTSQLGYGTTVSSISTNFTTGSGQFTGNPLDCMIDGTGFFIVGNYQDRVSVNLRESNVSLSRVGILRPDNNGYLVDNLGNYVYGYKTELNPVTGEITVLDTENLYPIQIPLHYTNAVDADGNARYTDDAGNDVLIDSSGAFYYVCQQATERVTIDESKIVYKDDKGNLLNLEDNNGTIQYYYKAKGNEKLPANGTVTQKLDDGGNPMVDENNNPIMVDADGRVVLADPDNPGQYYFTPVKGDKVYVAAGDVKRYDAAVDGHELNQVGGAWGYTASRGDKIRVPADSVRPVKTTVQERYNIATWTIGTDGNIIGVDVNNEIVSIGKIAVASVENPNGLDQGAGSLYNIGNNAGEVMAMETAGATGEFKSNYLEMANVDLASDIATMITTQRGYQANTKIITVTDEMLEQLVNMKR